MDAGCLFGDREDTLHMFRGTLLSSLCSPVLRCMGSGLVDLVFGIVNYILWAWSHKIQAQTAR